MKWITREHVHVDRVACPWLIRKYVDPDAEFLFVSPEKLNEISRDEQAIPFDAKGVELGHQGNDCSFETIIKKYKINDPILDEVAKVVHCADISVDIEKAPEARGLEAISRGQMFLVKNDYEAIERGAFLYDCLYMYFKYKRIIKEHDQEINNSRKDDRFLLIKNLVSK
jgi:hypothetical protein